MHRQTQDSMVASGFVNLRSGRVYCFHMNIRRPVRCKNRTGFRVSKKPLIVKKRDNPNVFEESLPRLRCPKFSVRCPLTKF